MDVAVRVGFCLIHGAVSGVDEVFKACVIGVKTDTNAGRNANYFFVDPIGGAYFSG